MPRHRQKIFGFSRQHRLGSKKAIDEIFSSGALRVRGFLRFRYLPQDLGYMRVVISISKRVGTSPERNRIKRLVRESLRLSGYLRTTSLDCAIFVTKPLQRKPSLNRTREYIRQFFSDRLDDSEK